MKKNVLLFTVLIFIFTGCDLFTSGPSEPTYTVGGTGQAGGIIIYDCDADNDLGNSDGLISSSTGWRYLEAAPGDISLQGEGIPYVNTDENYRAHMKFGFNRVSGGVDNLYVNNSTTFNESSCTSQELGEGMQNTERLANKMGNQAYTQDTGSSKYYYAAKLSQDLEYNGYSDWFLPSLEELQLVYAKKDIIGAVDTMPGTDYYWSSSEVEDEVSFAIKAYSIDFSDGTPVMRDRGNGGNEANVRCIRRFK